MRVFRGNCGQIAIFEAMLRSTGRVMKVKGGDEEPMFSSQTDFPSQVFFRTLLVKVDGHAKGILSPLAGDLYEVRVRYDVGNNKGTIRLTREVIDWLMQLVPDADKLLGVLEEPEENNVVAKAAPDTNTN